MTHVTSAPDLMLSRIRPARSAAFGFYLAAGLAAAVAFAWPAASLGVEAARRDGGAAESPRLTLAAWVATLVVLPVTPTARNRLTTAA